MRRAGDASECGEPPAQRRRSGEAAQSSLHAAPSDPAPEHSPAASPCERLDSAASVSVSGGAAEAAEEEEEEEEAVAVDVDAGGDVSESGGAAEAEEEEEEEEEAVAVDATAAAATRRRQPKSYARCGADAFLQLRVEPQWLVEKRRVEVKNARACPRVRGAWAH